MEGDTPTWLDASYLQKVLEKAEKGKSVEVSSIIVRAATAKGDNYASDMYRVNIVFTRVHGGQEITETKSLIVKVAPQDGIRQEMISDAGFFETEISMMSETLPRMNQILAQLGTASLSARCPHVQHEKPIHLIIEDLAPEGFRMADRQAGLDLDHCLLAIRNLAAFHASSVALVEKDPAALVKYKRGIFHKDHSATVGLFFVTGTKALAEAVAKWPEINPRISEKISKLVETIYEKGCEAALLREDDFNVLNHGDFWVNNMLFRYDGHRKPIDHMFVDFQICHYGTPAVDVLYFLGTSPSYDVRMNHRELLVREYHASLSGTMAKLKCRTKPPSLHSLQETLRKRAMCEVVSSFSVLPLVLVDKSQVKSLNEMMSSDAGRDLPAYQGKIFRKLMREALPLYDSMGLLDV